MTERREIAELEAPYRRQVRLEEIRHESGMKMFRVIIREGHRITQLDLDGETAGKWAALMGEWAARQEGGAA